MKKMESHISETGHHICTGRIAAAIIISVTESSDFFEDGTYTVQRCGQGGKFTRNGRNSQTNKPQMMDKMFHHCCKGIKGSQVNIEFDALKKSRQLPAPLLSPHVDEKKDSFLVNETHNHPRSSELAPSSCQLHLGGGPRSPERLVSYVYQAIGVSLVLRSPAVD